MIKMRTNKIFNTVRYIMSAAFIFIVFFVPLKIVFAAVTTAYVPLTSIPGLTAIQGQTGACIPDPITGSSAGCKTIDPIQVVKNIYGVSIGIAALLAVAMIIWAGVEYVTTAAVGGKSAAKEKWQGAIVGLLLLLSSYIILRTVNISLVNINEDLMNQTPIACTPTVTTDANGNTMTIPCAVSAGAVSQQITQSMNEATALIAQQTGAASTNLTTAETASAAAQRAAATAVANVATLTAQKTNLQNLINTTPPPENLSSLQGQLVDINANLAAAQQAVSAAQVNSTKATLAFQGALGMNNITAAVTNNNLTSAKTTLTSTENFMISQINTMIGAGASSQDIVAANAQLNSFADQANKVVAARISIDSNTQLTADIAATSKYDITILLNDANSNIITLQNTDSATADTFRTIALNAVKQFCPKAIAIISADPSTSGTINCNN